MTTKEFISHYLSIGGIDFDGAYGKQCVDLFRAYHRDVLGKTKQPRGVVGAKDFWVNYATDPELNTNYTKISNTADFKPLEGDVMIWSNGTYGHIAICNGVADLNTFQSLDQNWTGNREINIVTPETLHINSFMFEPIVDMSIDELKVLYKEVSNL